jgi:succinate dehydrogenase/fumarate reductase-like Fe-S protein
MVVNKPRGLACLRKAETDMIVEPLPNREIVHHLVIEFD